MSRLRAAVAAATTAAASMLALTGCGSSSLSTSRLRADATNICLRADAQSVRIQPPATPAGTSAFMRRGVAVLTPELAQLRRLRPPARERGAYSTMLGAFERELSILRTTSDGLDRGADPVSTIKTLQERLAPVESDEAAASRQLQIPACVSR
jgi:hypothetical protein